MWDYPLKLHASLPVECNDQYIGGTLTKVCLAARGLFDLVIAIGAVGEKDHEIISKKFDDTGVESMI